MKLELKHLASYLPYRLKYKFESEDFFHEVIGLDITNNPIKLISPFGDFGSCEINAGKPILFPLSSLTKDDIKNFYQFNNYDFKSIDLKEWAEDLMFLINEKEAFQLSQFEYLFSKKFDVFGLIEAGLAEPVTEDFNPYK